MCRSLPSALVPEVLRCLSPKPQSARMSKFKNYKWRLNPIFTGCFVAVPIWQQWAVNRRYFNTMFSYML